MGRKKKIEAIELKGKDRKNTHLSHVNLKRNSLFQKTISNQKKKIIFSKHSLHKASHFCSFLKRRSCLNVVSVQNLSITETLIWGDHGTDSHLPNWDQIKFFCWQKFGRYKDKAFGGKYPPGANGFICTAELNWSQPADDLTLCDSSYCYNSAQSVHAPACSDTP